MFVLLTVRERPRDENGKPRTLHPPARSNAGDDVILRLLRAMRSLAVDSHNYYRELFATNLRLRIGDPAAWLRFSSLMHW